MTKYQNQEIMQKVALVACDVCYKFNEKGEVVFYGHIIILSAQTAMHCLKKKFFVFAQSA